MAQQKVTPIYGTGNNDTLTVSKNGYNYVIGGEGNDTYIINNIKKSWTIVDDALQNYADMGDIFNNANSVSSIANAGINDTV